MRKRRKRKRPNKQDASDYQCSSREDKERKKAIKCSSASAATQQLQQPLSSVIANLQMSLPKVISEPSQRYCSDAQDASKVMEKMQAVFFLTFLCVMFRYTCLPFSDEAKSSRQCIIPAELCHALPAKLRNSKSPQAKLYDDQCNANAKQPKLEDIEKVQQQWKKKAEMIKFLIFMFLFGFLLTCPRHMHSEEIKLTQCIAHAEPCHATPAQPCSSSISAQPASSSPSAQQSHSQQASQATKAKEPERDALMDNTYAEKDDDDSPWNGKQRDDVDDFTAHPRPPEPLPEKNEITATATTTTIALHLK